MPYISEYFTPNPFRQMNTGPGKHKQLQHSQGKDFSVILAGQSSTVNNISESNQVQLSAKKEKKTKHMANNENMNEERRSIW